MNFVDELKWRGMIQDIMPGTEELLNKEIISGYIGFDPTSDSLHVGSLVPIMILLHFQRCGHKPIALIGGATGMIGDPSGKKEERKLLTLEDVRRNEIGIKKQLEKFLDFNSGSNAAELVNNNDWFHNIGAIQFLREVGKFLTLNYLLSKGFVKDRLEQEQEISYTEFNYILMQAYDFLWLYENKNVKLQMGGSDQWGNITAGTELIRKKIRGEAFGITTPLMMKADGGKFGKTESGNVWLDPQKTSPFAFYQFWLNASDEDVKKYIRIFSLRGKEEIEQLEAEHSNDPGKRLLQKTLAKEITIRVHSERDFQSAVESSQILFGESTTETLKKLSEEDFLSIFEGVPQIKMPKVDLERGINVVDFLSTYTKICSSKGDAKRMIEGNGIKINQKGNLTKIESGGAGIISLIQLIDNTFLINQKYILVQKGKKNYYIIKAE